MHGLNPKSIPVIVCGIKLDLCEDTRHNFWFVQYHQFDEIDVRYDQSFGHSIWQYLAKKKRNRETERTTN